MNYLADNSITINGARYWFSWTSSYQDEIDYDISEPNGDRFRAHLRRSLPDYARRGLNYDAAGLEKHVVASIGILRRCVGTNAGEISADTIAAFDAWRAREYDRQMSTMISQPHRYGDEASLCASFPAPLPVYAGRWTSESGWTRVELQSIAA
ncbi:MULTISPECIES: hypothetical protein [Mesorhizobium]|uniref:hypothetical protein n=1 Tax=Mesorhizobium TaxID=68287 RepID=UPI0007A93D62|nr:MULTISPECIES: hypothetical protein [Mesorhizobium]AMX93676.1 hypothetical protein A4R28_11485 [Mesorhizobium ciceri]MDF3208371.1 hypothetical protein [Mesorhizobium sp. LMG15046]MDF3229058.1 hypothetical protein [Mesorhizobium sp. DSM 30133]RUU22172.1 hypothetical protein EOC84_03410 [Mesorhizobium sp. Primo-B]RUU37918.1 hypothetical protein EOC83_16805 [Mesorhizobium sp. Primo-A]